MRRGVKANVARSLLAAIALGSGGAVWAGGPASQAKGNDTKTQTCVQVDIGNAHSGYLDCLNAELAQSVERETDRKQALQAAISGTDPTSSPNGIGLYNAQAEQEQIDAHKYRPPTYGPPLQPVKTPPIFRPPPK